MRTWLPHLRNLKALETHSEQRRWGVMADSESNTEKNPDDWSYLKTLLEQAHERAEISNRLTKAEASKEIDRLREKLGLAEPHKQF